MAEQLTDTDIVEEVVNSSAAVSKRLRALSAQAANLDRNQQGDTKPRLGKAIRAFVEAQLDQLNQPEAISDVPLSIDVRREGTEWVENELGIWVLQSTKAAIEERHRRHINELLADKIITATSPKPFFVSPKGDGNFSQGHDTTTSGPYLSIEPFSAILFLGGEPGGFEVCQVPLVDHGVIPAASISLHEA